MNDLARKLLYDVLTACEQLNAFNADKSFADYEQDAQLRAATERMFEIIGEDLTRLTRLSPETADRITDRAAIIAFRNRIIYGYDTVDNRTVWGIYEGNVPTLKREVEALLNEGE